MHAESPISELLEGRSASDLFVFTFFFFFLSDSEMLAQILLAEHTQSKSLEFLKFLSVSRDARKS